MALQIGDVAPDFEADTTEGRIKFHEWLGDSWGVLVSHPKDFTPVCTTELGAMAGIKHEFDKRNAKIIGIPFAIQHLKLAYASLFPIGQTVVDADVVQEARRNRAATQVQQLRQT